MVLRTVDISISIVGRLNATNQKEMQAVLRIRSMNCFQTFRAQLIFLSLKFFKPIHRFLVVLVLFMQCRSVIKLLQSVLLDNGTKARFMVFFLKFLSLFRRLPRERKSHPRIYKDQIGILIISLTLTCVYVSNKYLLLSNTCVAICH